MSDRVILLTIKRIYANQILTGGKSYEYRKTPPRISGPTRTILYISGDKEMIGECILEPVCGEKTAVGFPLPVRSPLPYADPIPWQQVKDEIPGIKPPVISFRYLKSTNAQDVELLSVLDRCCPG